MQFFQWRWMWQTDRTDPLDPFGPRLGYETSGWAGAGNYLGKVLVQAAGLTFPNTLT